MARKKIGIALWKIGENSFGSTLSYLTYMDRFGEVIPLMPKHSIRKDLDLLVLPGGPDVDPLRYGEAPDFFTSKPDTFKEYFDVTYLPKYIEAGVPVMGICRGMQSLAVSFSGKLIQDMSHETNKENDPYAVVHEIQFEEESFECKIGVPANNVMSVNSRHHQAVSRRYLPECFAVMASHKTDNTIEMIAHRTMPIVGVQWHPEDVFDRKSFEYTASIVRYLINEKKSLL